jgi:hypothetical protein
MLIANLLSAHSQHPQFKRMLSAQCSIRAHPMLIHRSMHPCDSSDANLLRAYSQYAQFERMLSAHSLLAQRPFSAPLIQAHPVHIQRSFSTCSIQALIPNIISLHSARILGTLDSSASHAHSALILNSLSAPCSFIDPCIHAIRAIRPFSALIANLLILSLPSAQFERIPCSFLACSIRAHA